METIVRTNETMVKINKETMRDFCGSFYKLAKTTHLDKVLDRNYKLVYLIPEATEAAVRNPENNIVGDEEIFDVYSKLLITGIENIYREIPDIVIDVMTGKKVEDIPADIIAKICDIYYVDTVPACVEIEALTLINTIRFDM